jgi:hypothetical protein
VIKNIAGIYHKLCKGGEIIYTPENLTAAFSTLMKLCYKTRFYFLNYLYYTSQSGLVHAAIFSRAYKSDKQASRCRGTRFRHLWYYQKVSDIIKEFFVVHVEGLKTGL